MADTPARVPKRRADANRRAAVRRAVKRRDAEGVNCGEPRQQCVPGGARPRGGVVQAGRWSVRKTYWSTFVCRIIDLFALTMLAAVSWCVARWGLGF